VYCAEKYILVTFLRAYRAAGVHVNMLKNNIKMDMKEIAIKTAWTEFNLINI